MSHPDPAADELLRLAGSLSAWSSQFPMGWAPVNPPPPPPPQPFIKEEVVKEICKALALLCQCEAERRKGPKLNQLEEFLKGCLEEVKSL